MNPVLDALKMRRSIRKFHPDMPDQEDLDQIIEAGLYAASVDRFQLLNPRTPGSDKAGTYCFIYCIQYSCSFSSGVIIFNAR